MKSVLALMLLIFSFNVYAGAEEPGVVVVIDEVNGSVYGSMTSARNSKNDVERIGCRVRATVYPEFGNFVFKTAMCAAKDANNTEAYCFTDIPELVDVVSAITSRSFITFEYDDSLNCTSISVSTHSIYLPKE